MPSPHSSPGDDRPSRRFKPWLLAGVSIAVIGVAAGVCLYALRGPIGTRLAVDYLAKRGIPATIEIERIDLSGFTGRVRLGPPGDPDLTVDRVEASFAPIPILKSGFTAPRITSLVLVHPRLKAAYDGRRFSFGSLQPLVDEALKAQPGAGPGPDVRVEGGELRLASYAGPLLVTGDAELEQGRLSRAAGHLAATTLTPKAGTTIKVQAGDLTANVSRDRLDANLKLSLVALEGPASVGPASLTAYASLPYGADGVASLDGAVAGEAHLKAARVQAAHADARDLDLAARLSGTAHGRLDRLALDLSTTLNGTAERLDAAGTGASKLRLTASADGLRWADRTLAATTVNLRLDAGAAAGVARPAANVVLSGVKAASGAKGWAGGAAVKLDATAAGWEQRTPVGRLTLAALHLTGGGRADLGAGAPPDLALAGSLTSGRGGIEAAQAKRFAQGLAGVADEAKVEAALRSFSLAAPAWRLTARGGATEVRLDRPVRIASASGPALTLSPAGGPTASIDAKGAATGAFVLAVSGAGAPGLDLAVSRYRLAGGKGDAAVKLSARFDGTLLHQATLEGAGSAVFDRAGGGFTPSGCMDARLARLGEDTPSFAEKLSARLCADGGAPFAAIGSDGWRVRARIEDGAADLPIAQASVDGGAARLQLSDHGGAASGRLELSALHAVDAATPKRFNPVRLSGTLDLAQGEWRGPALVRDAAQGRELATVNLRQTASSATGEAEIAADPLIFKPKVLQPVELSPVAGLVTQVDAVTHFHGRVAWKDGVVTSGGRLTTDGAAFNSLLGKVSGAHADVSFDSLLPPTAAPGQVFTATSIAWIAPLTDVGAHFALTTTATELADAHATAAHGSATLGAISIPFADDRTIMGVLTLKAIDLGELVAGSSLADSVSIQAKINGTVPFSAGPKGVSFTDGLVAATGPGRLSIKRQALAGAVATAGAAGAQPNAIQDFAYQALENLAFDSLEARVASRPGGRLGAIFTIKGRNDPPHATDSRIGVLDLIRGHAFDKPIDLPKGTPVDLTLDTSLNFDDLLKAYGEIGRGSAPVQP